MNALGAAALGSHRSARTARMMSTTPRQGPLLTRRGRY
jgi:hypothetical protein